MKSRNTDQEKLVQKIANIEERLSELEEQTGGVSRRDVLSGAAGTLAGVGLLSGATGSAAAAPQWSNANGQGGTESNPWESVTAQTVTTEQLGAESFQLKSEETAPYLDNYLVPRGSGNVGLNFAVNATEAATPLQDVIDNINNNGTIFTVAGQIICPPVTEASGPVTGWLNKRFTGIQTNYGSYLQESTGSNDLFAQANPDPQGNNRDGQYAHFENLVLNGTPASGDRTAGSAINLTEQQIRQLSLDNVLFFDWKGPDNVVETGPYWFFSSDWGWVEFNGHTNAAIHSDNRLGGTGWNIDFLLFAAPQDSSAQIQCGKINATINNMHGFGGNIGPLLTQTGTSTSNLSINAWSWENQGTSTISHIIQIDKPGAFDIGAGRIIDGTVDDVYVLGNGTTISGVDISPVYTESSDVTINNSVVAIDGDITGPARYAGPTSDVRKTSNAPTTLTEPLYCLDGSVT